MDKVRERQEMAGRFGGQAVLRAGDERFRWLVDRAHDGVVLTDTRGFIVVWNAAMERITGIEAGDAVGRTIWDVQRQLEYRGQRAPEAQRQVEEMVRVVLATGQAPWLGQPHTREVARPDGSWRFVEAVMFSIEVNDGFVLGGISRDVTEQKAAEEALRASEKRLRVIAANYPAYMSIVEKDLTIGFTSGREFAKQNLDPDSFVGLTLENIFGEHAPVVRERYLQAFAGEPVSFELCINEQVQRYDVVPLYEQDGEIRRILAVVEDITDRRRAEEEHLLNEMRLNSLLELSQMAHELSEPEIVQAAVEQAVRLTGSEIGYSHFVNLDQQTIRLVTWSASTMEQCTAVYETHYPIDQAGVWADCVRLGRPVVHNDYQSLPDKRGYPLGHAHLVRHVSVPVFDAGRVVLILGVGNKPTEYDESDVRQMLLIGDQLFKILQRRRADEQTRAALAQKEVLLKEIHHRVKNNLQVVSALLGFQADAIDDPRVHEAFEESQNRIHSMARIHDQLYQSSDLAQIEMGGYIEELVQDLGHTYAMWNLTFEVDAADVKLDLEKAVPSGLIINELVVNAVKHAFPPGRNGHGSDRICVLMQPRGGQLELVVRDNGVGLPPGLDLSGTRRLGLRLVGMLARQLQGTLEMSCAEPEGTAFKITFPVGAGEG